MVSKVGIILAIGLVGAFLLAGGGALTKEAITKTQTELKLVREGISSRTAKTKERSQ